MIEQLIDANSTGERSEPLQQHRLAKRLNELRGNRAIGTQSLVRRASTHGERLHLVLLVRAHVLVECGVDGMVVAQA